MLSPSEFETYLRIAREQHVLAFSIGDLAAKFLPEPASAPVIETDVRTAGDWKRGPTLDQDPELDTSWD